jgi:hypothetical protein
MENMRAFYIINPAVLVQKNGRLQSLMGTASATAPLEFTQPPSYGIVIVQVLIFNRQAMGADFGKWESASLVLHSRE